MENLFAGQGESRGSNRGGGTWDRPQSSGVGRVLVAFTLIAVVFGMVDAAANKHAAIGLVALSDPLERRGE